MNDRVKETYNQLAHDYEHRVDTNALYNIEYERPAMLKLLPQDLKNKRVLDAGCAAGWYSEQLIKRGAKVFAIDLSPEMVAATKRRIGRQADVHCLDLSEPLPFADGTFDLIVSSLVLHYLEEWGPVFREFKRILKPEGTLLYSVHHPFMDVKLSDNKDYFSTELIIDEWKRQGRIIEVPFYRHSLQSILNETLAYFTLEKLVEPQPTEEFAAKDPESYEWLMTNPHFMMIKAYRKGDRDATNGTGCHSNY